jgi:hypothetical protein
MKKSEPTSFADIFKARAAQAPVKAPAYPWQDLALRVIKELSIPNFKRSSVFKICKEKTAQEVERAINDTKELCKTGDQWKYFFKVVDLKESEKNKPHTYAKNTRYN